MQPTWGHAPAPPPWRDNRGFVRATAAVWCLVAVASVFLGVAEWRDLEDRVRDGGSFSAGFGLAGGPARGLGALVGLGGTVLAVIATWRLAKAQEQLGRHQARWGPGWAIASRVIPLANAVLPGLQLDELWRGSAPDARPGDPVWRYGSRSAVATSVIVATVVSFVISGIGGIVLAVAAVRDLDEPLSLHREQLADAIADARPWMIGAAVVGAAATVLNAWLLVRIADRQQVLHETMPVPAPPAAPAYGHEPAWGAPRQPAGWYPDPSGRFEWRWWDGTTWSAHVTRGGIAAHDPPPPGWG